MQLNLRSSLMLLLVALIPVTVMFSAAFAASIRLDYCEVKDFDAPGGMTVIMVNLLNGQVSFALRFHIYSAGYTHVGLGVTLTDPSGRPWNDMDHDVWSANIASSGYSFPERIFSPSLSWGIMPASNPGTPYQMTCAIWTGHPGYSTWLGSTTRTVYLNNPLK
jgi:hypothetical protein